MKYYDHDRVERHRSHFAHAQLELRATGQKMPTICGYAAVFDRPSDVGGLYEEVLRGAFARSLSRGDDVLATAEHDPARLLGRRSAGTLQVAEDTKGLHFEVRPPDTTAAHNLIALMRRGDIRGASFGFVVEGAQGQRWTSKGGRSLRQLISVRLLDVAIVAWPSYPDAYSALRSKRALLDRSERRRVP